MSYKDEIDTCQGKYNPEDERCVECGVRLDCMSSSILMVPTKDIDCKTDPFREKEAEKLDDSIKEKGFLEPLTAVFDHDKSRFRIIFGGRRFEAAKRLKIKEVPVIVKEADDLEAILLRFHENSHRENYSAIGTLKILEELRDKHGLKQKDIAKLLSKSEAWVSNVMGASKLPEKVKEKMKTGEVEMGVHRAAQLARMPEKKAEKLVEKGATKEQVEKASKGRKLKYQWVHKGKVDGIGFKLTLVFNDDEIEPSQIVDALEQSKGGV